MIKDYLRYSKEMKSVIIIESTRGKRFGIKVNDYDREKVFFTFLSNGQNGEMRISNIKSCQYRSDHEENNTRKRISTRNYAASQYSNRRTPRTEVKQSYNLVFPKLPQTEEEKNIDLFRKYYLELIGLLQSKENETSFEYEYFRYKKEMYSKIFNNLSEKEDCLLYQYFNQHIKASKKEDYLLKEKNTEPLLLLKQSNLSQKKAIRKAIKNKISVIEGPPGTGKTTTILSTIANLVCENKKVAVVSKNNSSIDNIVEELDKMPLPDFYIRLGNKQVMEELNLTIAARAKRYEEQLQQIDCIVTEEERNCLKELNERLVTLEEQVNQLVIARNERSKLHNQYRHLEKRKRAYDISDSILPKRYKKHKDKIKLKNDLEELAKMLCDMEAGEKITFKRKLNSFFTWRMSSKRLEKDGIALQLLLEEEYLKEEMKALEEEIDKDELKKLQEEIKEIYEKEYLRISKKILNQHLKEQGDKNAFDALYNKVREERNNPGVRNYKDELLQLYPVILTTVDAVLPNFHSYLKCGLDCVILDEASQCDLLSALPLLYLAKQIVVVGDCKQLSAIINVTSDELKTKVPEGYEYVKESFLSTILKIMKPESTILLEHYRCDYKIINYCNQYFYDNQLIIYNQSEDNSMILIDDNKGKYMDVESKSFYNEREIATIDHAINSTIEHKFVITPYRRQAARLARKYDRRHCGTIHTFQGRGEDEVYFCTVLNQTERAVKHIQSDNNLFTSELINVAVSRAKKRFVMVTDVEFFKQNDKNMKNLIEYIEAYGETIPDKTVCLFDYLYQQMDTYTKIGNSDNIFECTMQKYIEQYLKKHPEYQLVMKLPLAAVVTDGVYLREHPEIKLFIEHNAHLDYTIYDNRVNKPIIAIELDGAHHKLEKQIERDQKKDQALKHMEIKLWRIKSKVAMSPEEFEQKLEEIIQN